MNKREARRLAYRIAYRFVQSSIDVGGTEADMDGQTPEDQAKVDAELDRIAQTLFERGFQSLDQPRKSGVADT